MTKEEYELSLKMERDTKLAKGTLTSDGKFWFNESLAKVFILKAIATDFSSTLTSGKSFKWKTASGDIVDVTLKEAKAYTKEIIATLDSIYLEGK